MTTDADRIWNEALDAAIIALNRELRGEGRSLRWVLDVVRGLKRGVQADRPDHSGDKPEAIPATPKGQEKAIHERRRNYLAPEAHFAGVGPVTLMCTMLPPGAYKAGPTTHHRRLYFDIKTNVTRCFDCDTEVKIAFPERRPYETCHSDRDGDCSWMRCPQLADGEPYKTSRSCPLSKVER